MEKTQPVIDVKDIQTTLHQLQANGEASVLGELLGYQVQSNPMNPSSPWFFLQHPELDGKKRAVAAVMETEDLTPDSKVRDVRKLYEAVTEQKQSMSGKYDVSFYILVGVKRFIVFRAASSNRDERIDVSFDALDRSQLITDQLRKVHASSLRIEDDMFGAGKKAVIPEGLFKNDLGSFFSYTIQFYQKAIAQKVFEDEVIKKEIIRLLPAQEQKDIIGRSIERQLMNPSLKVAVGNVVNTIVLRVILRKFLEAYHGSDIFDNVEGNFPSLGMGERKGKMDEVIAELVDIRYSQILEEDLKKQVDSQQEITMNLFGEYTLGITAKDESFSLPDFYDEIRKQFEMAYGGDLFSGDIASVTNKVERLLNERHNNMLVNLIVDLSEQRFNFRYEDIPPEMIQDFYESSMSKTLAKKIGSDGKPVIYYGEDDAEKKVKGAYYTKDELVSYSVDSAISERFEPITKKVNYPPLRFLRTLKWGLLG